MSSAFDEPRRRDERRLESRAQALAQDKCLGVVLVYLNGRLRWAGLAILRALAPFHVQGAGYELRRCGLSRNQQTDAKHHEIHGVVLFVIDTPTAIRQVREAVWLGPRVLSLQPIGWPALISSHGSARGPFRCRSHACRTRASTGKHGLPPPTRTGARNRWYSSTSPARMACAARVGHPLKDPGRSGLELQNYSRLEIPLEPRLGRVRRVQGLGVDDLVCCLPDAGELQHG